MTEDSPQTDADGPLATRVIGLAAAPALGTAARRLAAALGAQVEIADAAAVDFGAAWSASGVAALSGPVDRPAVVPFGADLARNLRAASIVLNALAGTQLVADPLALLTERVMFTGMTRQGSTSVGGSCHLLRCRDGWLAVNLARPSDIELLPAWLPGGDPSELALEVGQRSARELREQAVLLGLPVGVLGETAKHSSPFEVLAAGETRGRSRRVLDLTSLWAGPLCGRLLAAAGYDVVKVEGKGRPDGARRGPRGFFDLMNAHKHALVIDFDDSHDVERLKGIMRTSALVLEGSRPRVMDRLGVNPADLVEQGVSWVSITAYGRTGVHANRVGFGDDTAVAGGLVAGDPPNFVGDAIADPITGLYAAIAAFACLLGRPAAIDVALARAAAFSRLA